KDSTYEIPKDEYLVISPGGGSNPWSDMVSRRWIKENFLEIIKKIDKKRILIGGETDKEICDFIEKEVNDSKKICNLSGSIKLEDTAKIIKNCKIFIGNDSMPLFLANSYDIESIGIFTSTDGSKIMSLDRTFIQAGCNCSPCYNPLEGTGKGIAYTCSKLDCTKDKSILIKLEDILKNKGVIR
ncbi:MAG: glycosyltransferase family 9 protein, partial [Cetobacterium sp.]